MLAIWWTNLNFTCRNQNFSVCFDASLALKTGLWELITYSKSALETPCGVKSKSSVFCFQEPETYELSHINHFQICHSPHVESKSQRPSLFGGFWKKCRNLSSTQAPLVFWQSRFVNWGKDHPSFPLYWPVPGERLLVPLRVQETNHVDILQVHSNLKLFFNTIDQNIHLNYSSLN